MNSLLPLLIFMVATVVAWRSPRIGVWLTVLAIPAYVIKFTVGPIPTTLVEIILWGTAVGWLVRQPVVNLRALISSYRPLRWQLVLLAVGLVVGVAVSGDLRLSLGIVKGWFIDPILLYGLILVLLDRRSINLLVPLLLLSTLPISIMAIGQALTGHFITIDHRASAWFISANYLSLYLVPILLLGTSMLFDPGYRRPAPFYWIVSIPGLIALYFSYSYGGWLAMVAGGLVIGIWQFRHRWQFWVGSAAVALLAAATQITNERITRMFNFKLQSSASVRLQVWAADWLMVKEHWLTGIGLGRYPARYPEFVTRLFPTPLEPAMLHAHNVYLQFIINLGFIGLVAFGSLVVTFFRWVRHCQSHWATPLTAAMTALLVHGLVDTPYWKNDLSLVFWILLAIAAVAGRPKEFKAPL